MRRVDSLRRWLRPLLAALLAAGTVLPARAWNDHALLTWLALQPMVAETAGQPAARAALRERVRAESLEAFVAAEAPRLERLLAEHEAWARANLQAYDARPDDIAFRAGDAAVSGTDALAASAALRQRFLMALRVNPDVPMALVLKLRPGADAGARALLPWNAVSTLPAPEGGALTSPRFAALAADEEVDALEVLATASQEPDHGLDIGLYADSGSAHGKRYGFGEQPFGNPALAYGSQAPVHMGFHHEAGLVFAAAGFLRRTQPEARIALYLALSRHALASGHRYWGWRFAGWALHYAQDLTVPYHASILPGVSTLRMITINTAALLGWPGPKAAATTLVSNRHAVIESYQQQHLAAAWQQRPSDDALLAALGDTAADTARGAYTLADTRAQVSREAHDAAAALDAQIERSFPARYTADPQVELGTEPDRLDMVAIARAHSVAEQERLVQQLATLMRRLAAHTRAFVRGVLVEPAAGLR